MYPPVHGRALLQSDFRSSYAIMAPIHPQLRVRIQDTVGFPNLLDLWHIAGSYDLQEVLNCCITRLCSSFTRQMQHDAPDFCWRCPADDTRFQSRPRRLFNFALQLLLCIQRQFATCVDFEQCGQAKQTDSRKKKNKAIACGLQLLNKGTYAPFCRPQPETSKCLLSTTTCWSATLLSSKEWLFNLHPGITTMNNARSWCGAAFCTYHIQDEGRPEDFLTRKVPAAANSSTASPLKRCK